MHEKSKGKADVNRTGKKEHSLDNYDEENSDSNAFKEVFGDYESGKAYESDIAGKESGEDDLQKEEDAEEMFKS